MLYTIIKLYKSPIIHIFSYLCAVFNSGYHKDPKVNKKAHFFRALACYLLSLTLLAGTFPKSLVLLDYYLDTDAYAAYCINKDKPEMECNGMCQVDDMMNKMDHHDHNHPDAHPESILIVYTVPTVTYSELQEPFFQEKIYFPKYHEFFTQEPYDKLLRPPQSLI